MLFFDIVYGLCRNGRSYLAALNDYRQRSAALPSRESPISVTRNIFKEVLYCITTDIEWVDVDIIFLNNDLEVTSIIRDVSVVDHFPGKSVTPLQEAKKQLSLEEVIQKANKWDVNNVNSKKIDKLIGEMIALQNLPFNFVEGLGFRRLIQEIAPRYNFRGRNFFTEFVYPSSNASLLSLTCHGIASDFERSSIILKCETFDDRHTGDILAEKFDTMLSEWNISNDQVHCMIRDEGSNMKRAMRLAKLQDLDCAVHKMQLAIRSSLNSQENIKGIKQKCKKISTHFNHSTIAQKQLHKIQDKLNQPHLKVFQDCVTRWNSTYYMLERFLKAKDALNLYINDSEIDPISPEEWKIIECCVELLKPFEEATRELSSSYTLISSVIPIIRMLTQKRKFSTLLEEENSYIIATYLDPRYKNKFFTSLTEEKIKDDILKISRNTEDILASRTISPSTERAKKMKMTDSMDTDTERPGTSGTGRQSCLISDLAMILDSSSDDESQKTPEINNPDVILKELLIFGNKKQINLNECPLKWWSVNQSEFKLLSKMARKFLSAPPASVPKIRIRIRGCEPLKIRIRIPHTRMWEKVDPQHP
ncbi:Zinc finger BED domain-containing protein 4 [Eumeta japonica]|uniref:Zinc finger BED domain-containing protein 4 n=1 Tax=Eumeta variegata TaxID=151549 RepID=A0A4C1Z0S7_EUMVA|nr:Zinc finger BED domain-containing protein 4 [Eumeta japonica]